MFIVRDARRFASVLRDDLPHLHHVRARSGKDDISESHLSGGIVGNYGRRRQLNPVRRFGRDHAHLKGKFALPQTGIPVPAEHLRDLKGRHRSGKGCVGIGKFHGLRGLIDVGRPPFFDDGRVRSQCPLTVVLYGHRNAVNRFVIGHADSLRIRDLLRNQVLIGSGLFVDDPLQQPDRSLIRTVLIPVRSRFVGHQLRVARSPGVQRRAVQRFHPEIEIPCLQRLSGQRFGSRQGDGSILIEDGFIAVLPLRRAFAARPGRGRGQRAVPVVRHGHGQVPFRRVVSHAAQIARRLFQHIGVRPRLRKGNGPEVHVSGRSGSRGDGHAFVLRHGRIRRAVFPGLHRKGEAVSGLKLPSRYGFGPREIQGPRSRIGIFENQIVPFSRSGHPDGFRPSHIFCGYRGGNDFFVLIVGHAPVNPLPVIVLLRSGQRSPRIAAVLCGLVLPHDIAVFFSDIPLVEHDSSEEDRSGFSVPGPGIRRHGLIRVGHELSCARRPGTSCGNGKAEVPFPKGFPGEGFIPPERHIHGFRAVNVDEVHPAVVHRAPVIAARRLFFQGMGLGQGTVPCIGHRHHQAIAGRVVIDAGDARSSRFHVGVDLFQNVAVFPRLREGDGIRKSEFLRIPARGRNRYRRRTAGSARQGSARRLLAGPDPERKAVPVLERPPGQRLGARQAQIHGRINFQRRHRILVYEVHGHIGVPHGALRLIRRRSGHRKPARNVPFYYLICRSLFQIGDLQGLAVLQRRRGFAVRIKNELPFRICLAGLLQHCRHRLAGPGGDGDVEREVRVRGREPFRRGHGFGKGQGRGRIQGQAAVISQIDLKCPGLRIPFERGIIAGGGCARGILLLVFDKIRQISQAGRAGCKIELSAFRFGVAVHQLRRPLHHIRLQAVSVIIADFKIVGRLAVIGTDRPGEAFIQVQRCVLLHEVEGVGRRGSEFHRGVSHRAAVLIVSAVEIAVEIHLFPVRAQIFLQIVLVHPFQGIPVDFLLQAHLIEDPERIGPVAGIAEHRPVGIQRHRVDPHGDGSRRDPHGQRLHPVPGRGDRDQNAAHVLGPVYRAVELPFEHIGSGISLCACSFRREHLSAVEDRGNVVHFHVFPDGVRIGDIAVLQRIVSVHPGRDLRAAGDDGSGDIVEDVGHVLRVLRGIIAVVVGDGRDIARIGVPEGIAVQCGSSPTGICGPGL